MNYKNLIIVGTSHIAKQSIEEVKRAILENKPSIVALELDKNRYAALVSGNRRRPSVSDISQVGLNGYLFGLIGQYVEKKLGKSVGVEPGAEMLMAIKLAREHNLMIALVDQDITVTLKKLSKHLSWKEKVRFVADLLRSALFKEKELKKYNLEKMDLSKVPEEETISRMMLEMKKYYPNIYRVLVEERNEVIARNLKTLMENNEDKKILAVVGAGHERAILKLLKQSKHLYKRKTTV